MCLFRMLCACQQSLSRARVFDSAGAWIECGVILQPEMTRKPRDWRRFTCELVFLETKTRRFLAFAEEMISADFNFRRRRRGRQTAKEP